MKKITINTPIGTKVKEISVEEYKEYEILKVFENKKHLWITINIFGKYQIDALAKYYEIIEEKIKYPDFSNAKVGDIVYSSIFGKGIVEQIFENKKYPISVRFTARGIETFKFDGCSGFEMGYPTLFWQPILIPDEAYIKPLPKNEN